MPDASNVAAQAFTYKSLKLEWRSMYMSTLLQKETLYCHECDQEHELELRKEITKTLIKKIPVEHEEIFYYCPISEESFYTEKLQDQTLLVARDAYRKMKGLLTSSEIKEIRKMYDLTQIEFSRLLGWGDITIQRYETKSIQDETYDKKMREIRENPLKALEELNDHQESFSIERYIKIEQEILRSKEKGVKSLKREILKSLYLEFIKPDDENGFQKLNLDKLEQILLYFTQHCDRLYKVKLMKLLWYVDALHYKNHGRSVTGLVYKHLPLGAVPIGYDEIITAFEGIQVKEEYIPIEDEERIAFRITGGRNSDFSKLEPSEAQTVIEVTTKFKDYGSRDLSDYMHQEEAYLKTKAEQVIPYSLAKNIKDF
jgi:putative zinc finger/helix-turn-helix YgiT family protein